MEWISVKDRLPLKECVGYVYDGKIIRDDVYFERSEHKWEIHHKLDHCIDITDSITHWMPLPNPPELDEK